MVELSLKAEIGILSDMDDQIALQYIKRGLRLAQTMLRDSVMAEDATHFAFEKTWSKRHTLQDPKVFWSYMKTTLVRHIWKVQAQDRKQELREQISDVEDPKMSTEEVVDQKNKREMVQKAMKLLSAQKQQVIELRMGGLNYQEIAELLNVKPTTIRVVYHQAIDQLKKGIGE